MNFTKTDVVFIGALTTVAAFAIPGFVDSQVRFNAIRAKYAENQEVMQQSKIADQRYQNGCLPLVRGKHPNLTYAPIVAGEMPVDRHTGSPYPENTVVCDSNGATGVINATGAIASVAVTPNRDVVAARLKRFRGGVYSQPVVEDRK